MIVIGPFHELELADQGRLQPSAVRHFLLRESLSPTAAARFREIDEWTVGDFERAELLEQLLRVTRA